MPVQNYANQFLRALSTSTAASTDTNHEVSMSHVSAWVGLQALTAFFVIVAAVGCAFLLRPLVITHITARQYNPI